MLKGGSMSVKRKVSAIGLSALALVGVGGVAGTGDALAGSNGQHVQIVAPTGDKGAWLKGKNASGKAVQEFVGLGPSGWSSQFVIGTGKDWWKGRLVIDWIKNDRQGSFSGETTCNVPAVWLGDTFPCSK
jgi:hypothetical protein